MTDDSLIKEITINLVYEHAQFRYNLNIQTQTQNKINYKKLLQIHHKHTKVRLDKDIDKIDI